MLLKSLIVSSGQLIKWRSLSQPLMLFQSYSRLSRIPIRVYDPKDGEFEGRKKQSLAKIPAERKDDGHLAKLKTSGDLFKSVMGDIFTTKNKSQIALEGGRLVEEGLKFGLKLNFLFLLKSLKTYPEAVARIVERESAKPQPNPYDPPALKVGPEVHRIGLRVLQEWSAVDTPPGIIGIFDRPSELIKKCLFEKSHKSIHRQAVPLTVVLDQIRDPGNLGSIMRSSAGIGCKLFLSKGCADPWAMKSLRGGNGAQFLIPIRTDVNLESLHQYIDLDELFQNQDAGQISQNSVVGQEEMQTRGNAGIGIFLADSGVGDDSFGLPIVPYTSVHYSSFKSIYLIVGGETTGLSNSVKEAVVSLRNIYPEVVKTVSRINVPMYLPIDSLNVANAFGIIGYEITRQYSIR